MSSSLPTRFEAVQEWGKLMKRMKNQKGGGSGSMRWKESRRNLLRDSGNTLESPDVENWRYGRATNCDQETHFTLHYHDESLAQMEEIVTRRVAWGGLIGSAEFFDQTRTGGKKSGCHDRKHEDWEKAYLHSKPDKRNRIQLRFSVWEITKQHNRAQKPNYACLWQQEDIGISEKERYMYYCVPNAIFFSIIFAKHDLSRSRKYKKALLRDGWGRLLQRKRRALVTWEISPGCFFFRSTSVKYIQ